MGLASISWTHFDSAMAWRCALSNSGPEDVRATVSGDWAIRRARSWDSKMDIPDRRLFLFSDHGDCLAAKLRPGNVSSADDWASCWCRRLTGSRRRASAWRSAADAAFARPAILRPWTPRRVVAKVEHHVGELFPRVGFIVTNLLLPNRAVVRFYNKRGTAEQWIKEGKQAAHWTRLSCHRFLALAVSEAHRSTTVDNHTPA